MKSKSPACVKILFIAALIGGILALTTPVPAATAEYDYNKDGCESIEEIGKYLTEKLPGGTYTIYEGKVNENLRKTFLEMGAPQNTVTIVSYDAGKGMTLVGAFDAKGCSLGATSIPSIMFASFLEDAKNDI